MNIDDASERVLAEIKRRAAIFAQDNNRFLYSIYSNSQKQEERFLLLIESAMLIGASIGSEVTTDIFMEEKPESLDNNILP